MSINLKVATRYSKALYSFASESNQNDVIYREMKSLYHLISVSYPLKVFFNSMILTVRKKKKVCDIILKKYSSITQNFIYLIIKHKRDSCIQEIINQYEKLYEEYNNITRVYITIPINLDDKIINKIIYNYIPLKDNTKILIKKIINPMIIGGYILRWKDYQINLSIQEKLSKLKKI